MVNKLSASLAAAAILLATALHFSPDLRSPDETAGVPADRLGPYRPGMTLREVFESFPHHGAQTAGLRLLEDNNAAWAARWRLLDKAERRIDISYFILSQDVFGVATLSHLLHKARHGVRVRVLLDAYGSQLSWNPKGNDYLDALINTGNVEIRTYRPLIDRFIDGMLSRSLAMTVASEHDKILVVDDRYAITGGRNLATEYFAHPADDDGAFHDMEVEVAGRAVVGDLRRAFERQYRSEGASRMAAELVNLTSRQADLLLAYHAMDDWLRSDGGMLPELQRLAGRGHDWARELMRMRHLQGRLRSPLPPVMRAEVRVLDSTTRHKAPEDIITRAGERLVAGAREEIFIQNPFVVLADAVVDTFACASRRDVSIVLFTNSPASSTSAVSQAFFLEQWPFLLARVATLQLYGSGEARMIHAKLATFDRTLSLVGTYNLSPLSMATNSEVVLAVWSREFARRLTQKARARLAAGEPGVYRYRLARNSDGSPKYAENGRPVAAFGPEDHTDTENMTELRLFRHLLRAAGKLPGVSPFF